MGSFLFLDLDIPAIFFVLFQIKRKAEKENMMSLIISDSKTYDTKNIILICCYCFAFNDTFMFMYSATMVPIWNIMENHMYVWYI